ncbi:MAG: 1,4-dihydroxy-2-naphthoate polyprenyltransferase [Microscillaceae bacterium]|nr:1,4-dihydroxy-2-naphthoate polyprenyltransferase [Microscillaceae bacterium]MDW8460151.1 1,4-dihydroxy-2-naphthoate polyprenyltransferase [Cytophagales bacterium]
MLTSRQSTFKPQRNYSIPMAQIKAWLKAFRLRTLPLSLASILMGSFLAYSYSFFQLPIFVLSVSTTIFLQILSNLANDYGDYQHGADSQERTWATRTVQSGEISPQAMLNAIILFTLLAFASGLALLYVAFKDWQTFFLFLGLGLLAILAAIAYTLGKKPYGYIGLGDISVFIFFGLVAVLGTFYLHTQLFLWQTLLPAISCGLLATAVLNINNIRDLETDKKAGKRSIPVRLGREKAVYYHITLLSIAFLCGLAYVMLHFKHVIQLLLIFLPLPLFYLNAKAIYEKRQAQLLDPHLRQMVLTTLFFVFCLGLGLIL